MCEEMLSHYFSESEGFYFSRATGLAQMCSFYGADRATYTGVALAAFKLKRTSMSIETLEALVGGKKETQSI